MSLLAAHPGWLAQLHAAAEQPPARPRVPLWWEEAAIGSVVPELAQRLPASSGLWGATRAGQEGFELRGELTGALARLALVLRDAGLAHAWRDEQLAVRAEDGRLLGTVERAAVRPLGIASHAVHLLACAPDGAHWVQQRALNKANDPGLWDTLMGGMVPASDTLEQALARETWEEAGLRLAQLEALSHGGQVRIRRPCGGDEGMGYIVEQIDWWRCVLPEGTEPANQDGEVAQFQRLPAEDLLCALLGGAFTLEAALVLAASGL